MAVINSWMVISYLPTGRVANCGEGLLLPSANHIGPLFSVSFRSLLQPIDRLVKQRSREQQKKNLCEAIFTVSHCKYLVISNFSG